MNNKVLVLWWEDVNWKKKGAAENLVCTIDFENSILKKSITCNIPNGRNCLEVKRKSDLTDYIESLIRLGFVER